MEFMNDNLIVGCRLTYNHVLLLYLEVDCWFQPVSQIVCTNCSYA